MPDKRTISKFDLQRMDAHKAIDLLFDEIYRARLTGEVTISLTCNQGGIRSSFLSFGLNDFLTIRSLPGKGFVSEQARGLCDDGGTGKCNSQDNTQHTGGME